MPDSHIPQLVGHRGYMAHYPENTWLGLEAALNAGACWLEFDVQMCAGGHFVLLHDSDAVMVLASADFRSKLNGLRDRCPQVRADGWVAMLDDEPGWRPFDDLLAAAPPGSRPQAVLNSGDRFNIIYSSGTTGLPKGIVQTHRARTHWAFSNAIELGMGGQSRALTTTSLYSNGTWLMMLPVQLLVPRPSLAMRSMLSRMNWVWRRLLV